MQNANVKKSTHKMVARKVRAPRISLNREAFPEFMIRIAREHRVRISEVPRVPKYRHD